MKLLSKNFYYLYERKDMNSDENILHKWEQKQEIYLIKQQVGDAVLKANEIIRVAGREGNANFVIFGEIALNFLTNLNIDELSTTSSDDKRA
jgi:hypothetical protein